MTVQPRYIARIYFIILFTISLAETRVFNFMTLNLFLTYIPFELCLLLKLFKPKKHSSGRYLLFSDLYSYY